jgi:predicted glutamine amidotransferase
MFDTSTETKLTRHLVRPLTEMNILGINASANHDGFGYMLFENPGEIFKDGVSATHYWTKEFSKFYKKYENPNGIYHVRAASGFGVNKVVKDENAHPFKHGNIVVAHNGTLREKEDYFLSDRELDISNLYNNLWIDSERFCFALNEICGDDLLEAKHIEQAYDMFTDIFAFLIYDIRQPEKVFIVRGKTKQLHCLTVYSGKKRIGMIINTGQWELLYLAKMIKYTLGEYLNINKLSVGVAILEEEGIYEYTIGSYNIGKPVRRIKETSSTDFKKPVADVQPSWKKSSFQPEFNDINTPTHNKQTIQAYCLIAELCHEMNLSLKEIWILSEIFNGKNICLYNLQEMEDFLELLKEIDNDATYAGKMKEWANLKEEFKMSALEFYKQTDIHFPYLLASRKDIKSVGVKIRKLIKNAKKEENKK